MASTPRLAAASALALALCAAACKERTGPAAGPTALANALGAMTATFSGSAPFSSMSALAPAFTLAAPPARAARGAPGPSLALFPTNVQGKVFEWDTAGGGKYRIRDSTLKALNDSAVRFALYVVIPGSGRPLLNNGVPQKLGYVDLVDVSNVHVNALRVVVELLDLQPISDYTLSSGRTTTTDTLAATGFISDGVSQTVFKLQRVLTYSPDTVLATNFTLTRAGTVVTMLTTVRGSTVGSATIDWLVQRGGSIEIAGTASPSLVNLTLKLNGATVATVGGSPAAPSFSQAAGAQLTTADLLALGAVLQGFYAVTKDVAGVFSPARLVF